MSAAKCADCSQPIDAYAVETKRKIAADLYPGREPTPPKRCTRCLWSSLKALGYEPTTVDDAKPGAGEEE